MKDITDFKRKYPDIDCCLTDERDVAVLCGGLQEENPEAYLIEASKYLMDGDSYNEYVEEYLDNPWVRVLITSIDHFTSVEREGYSLYYKDLPGDPGVDGPCRISILVGGFGKVNPNSYMDYMVYEYIGNNGHNTYIDPSMKNPWVRVIIVGLNNLHHV